jgi:hypothetical protein
VNRDTQLPVNANYELNLAAQKLANRSHYVYKQRVAARSHIAIQTSSPRSRLTGDGVVSYLR